jgi:hypothetical protein
MDEWIFVALLHNLPVKTTIGNRYIAVVSPTDPRVEALRLRSSAFCQLVDGFKDQFQRRAQPSLLMLRKNIHPRYEGLVAFRNALAIVSITKAWQNHIGYGSQWEYLKYSNYFDFYPYTLSKDEQWLLTHTASGFGGDEAERFQGQTSPEITRAGFLLQEQFYDDALFAALLDKWVECYVRRKKREWPTRALFRSLDMAYRASAIAQLNMYDFGANLALWVSAFEILIQSWYWQSQLGTSSCTSGPNIISQQKA